MRTLIFLDSARLELRSIFTWIVKQTGTVKQAQDVLREIETKIKRVADQPFQIGTKADESFQHGLYKIIHKRFVIYVSYPDEATLEIVTILWGGRHAARYFETLAKSAES